MRTAVIIPCYKVKNFIDKVIKEIPEFVNNIIIVDDSCPEKTGEYVLSNYSNNKKIVVIINKKNLGVGGATLNGFDKAQELKNDIFVKVDGEEKTASILYQLRYNSSKTGCKILYGEKIISTVV